MRSGAGGRPILTGLQHPSASISTGSVVELGWTRLPHLLAYTSVRLATVTDGSYCSNSWQTRDLRLGVGLVGEAVRLLLLLASTEARAEDRPAGQGSNTLHVVWVWRKGRLS